VPIESRAGAPQIAALLAHYRSLSIDVPCRPTSTSIQNASPSKTDRDTQSVNRSPNSAASAFGARLHCELGFRAALAANER
jgi:hypothetical protein